MARITRAKSKEQNEEIPVTVPSKIYTFSSLALQLSVRAAGGIHEHSLAGSDVNCFTILLLPDFPISHIAPKPFPP
jgi:hypothetical protein